MASGTTRASFGFLNPAFSKKSINDSSPNDSELVMNQIELRGSKDTESKNDSSKEQSKLDIRRIFSSNKKAKQSPSNSLSL